MNKFFAIVGPITFGSLLVLWCSAGHAADRTETIKMLPDGSVEVCQYETDFATAKDGALVIRTAWRCVTTKAGVK